MGQLIADSFSPHRCFSSDTESLCNILFLKSRGRIRYLRRSGISRMSGTVRLSVAKECIPLERPCSLCLLLRADGDLYCDIRWGMKLLFVNSAKILY